MDAEIEFFPRVECKKTASKAQRRAGQVPCIVYAQGKTGETGLIARDALEAVIRKLESGFLPTTVFVLKDAKGKKRRCIIKEIQYDAISYLARHIDFLELVPSQDITVNVPLTCLGVAECVGIKAGGFLRQVKRHIPVRCKPEHMPKHFELNVATLDMRQSRSVADIAAPKGVRFLVGPKEVVATIVK